MQRIYPKYLMFEISYYRPQSSCREMRMDPTAGNGICGRLDVPVCAGVPERLLCLAAAP